MITSAHSKSSNSSGFNPILQKFYEMICEMIVSKTVCRVFLIFCRWSFINNFMVKKNFLEPKNHRKLKISRSIYFKKISAHRSVDLICIFFTTAKPLIWASFFSTKINFILFFKGDYLILI